MRSLNRSNHYVKGLFPVAVNSNSNISLTNLVSVIFVFFITVSSWAQPKFKTFDAEYGLSSSSLRGIVQDQFGYLWIATEDGLNRFDGNSFKVYKYSSDSKNSIASNTINSIAVDNLNRIWLGHPSSITCFDPTLNLFTRYKVDSTTSWPSIHSIDKHNRVWVSLHGYGLVVLNPETGSIEKRYDLTPFIEKYGYFHATEMFEDSSGNVWMATSDGLYLFDSKLNTVKPVRGVEGSQVELGDEFFTSIQGDSQGEIWLSSYLGKIYHYSPKQNSFFSYKPDSRKTDKIDVVSRIRWKSDRELWFVCGEIGKSIATFDIETSAFSFIKFPNSFEIGTYINDLFVDRNGVIWFSSVKGLAMMNPWDSWNFKPHFKSDSLVTIRAVVEDTIVEKKFLAVDGLGLVVSNFNDSQVRSFNTNADGLSDLLNTSGDSLWVTSRGNVRLFDKVREKWMDTPELKKLVAPPNESTPNFRRIIKASSGDYWIISARNGAYWLRGSDLSFKNYKANSTVANSICSNTLLAVLEDKFGRIWFASNDKGISIFDPASNTFKTLSDKKKGSSFLPRNVISDLDIDSDGNIWISTVEVGIIKINVFSKDSLSLVPLDKDLASGVHELKIDRQGRVWFRRSNDVSVLDPKTMSIKSFEKRNGILDVNRSLLKSNNHILVNGTMGYGLIDEEDLLPDTNENPLAINSLKVFGVEIFPEGENKNHINLPYDQNSFAIDFEAIDLLNNKKIRYSYKLEGLENSEWSAPSRNRSTEFANLVGGDYIFKLKSSNQDDIWSKEKNLLYIHVETPFWKTKWFYASLFALTVGVIVLIYWYQINRIKKREEEKGETNKRISQLQLKALHTQMRPHFIFNCISAINGHIVKLETAKATEFLSQFARLMRGILENSTESWITLEQEVETLRLYLNMEGLRFEDKFSYQLEVEEGINPPTILIPSMIIQPYVENAIDHGLLHKEQGTGTVSIKFLRGDGHLKCIIEDNGVGRERAKQIRERSRISRKSLGLQITSERLQLLQGSSVAEIQDLKNELGEATGTRIIIMLMTKKAQEKELTHLN